MKDVSSGEGRTVLFVSHNMQAVSTLCNKGVLLKKGQVDYTGDVPVLIDRYLNSYQETDDEMDSDPDSRPGVGLYRFTRVAPTKRFYECAEEKVIEFRIEQRYARPERMYLTGSIVNEQGMIILQLDSRLVGKWIRGDEVLEGNFCLKYPWLKPGKYRVDLHIYNGDSVIDAFEGACTFNVAVEPYPNSASEDATQKGVVFADYEWNTLQ